jgi:hypothetical protein
MIRSNLKSCGELLTIINTSHIRNILNLEKKKPKSNYMHIFFITKKSWNLIKIPFEEFRYFWWKTKKRKLKIASVYKQDDSLTKLIVIKKKKFNKKKKNTVLEIAGLVSFHKPPDLWLRQFVFKELLKC